jgi:hypothetical protein
LFPFGVMIHSGCMTKDQKNLERVEKEIDRRLQEHLTESPDQRRSRRFRRRWRRRLLAVLALVLLAFAGVFLFNFLRLNSHLIDGHIKSGVIPNITQGRFSLDIERISGNLLNGVHLHQVSLRNPWFSTGGVLLTVPRIELEYSLIDVFWGNLVLHKVVIESPTVVLGRAKDGRAIWDFTFPASGPATVSTVNPAVIAPGPVGSDSTSGSGRGKRTRDDRWLRAEQTQAMADRYLAHLEIRNVTILVPNPAILLPDPAVAAMLRMPRESRQYGPFHLLLKKYPHPDFTSHILEVDGPDRKRMAQLEVSRVKAGGHVTVMADGWGQNLTFGLRNLGEGGRDVLLYDVRDQKRMNLAFRWARARGGPMKRIQGIDARFDLSDLSRLGRLLPGVLTLGGRLTLAATASPGVSLADAHFDGQWLGGTLAGQGIASLTEIDLSLSGGQRRLEIKHGSCVWNGIPATFTGRLLAADSEKPSLELASIIQGEAASVAVILNRLGDDRQRVRIELTRGPGRFGMAMDRTISSGEVSYGRSDLDLHIASGSSLWDVVPRNLLSAGLNKQLGAVMDRLDLVGPVVGTAQVPELRKAWQGSGTLCLDGARLVNRQDPSEVVDLAGTVTWADGDLRLQEVGGSIGPLILLASGTVSLDRARISSPEMDVTLHGRLRDGLPLIISGESMARRLGLSKRPAIDSLEIHGRNLLSGSLTTGGGRQILRLTSDRVRWRAHKQAWWVDDLRVEASAVGSWTVGAPWVLPVAFDLSGHVFDAALGASGTIDPEPGHAWLGGGPGEWGPVRKTCAGVAGIPRNQTPLGSRQNLARWGLRRSGDR